MYGYARILQLYSLLFIKYKALINDIDMAILVKKNVVILVTNKLIIKQYIHSPLTNATVTQFSKHIFYDYV